MPQLQPLDNAAWSKVEDKIQNIVEDKISSGNVPSIVRGNDVIHHDIINGMEANPWPWQVSIQVMLQVLNT